MRYTPCHAEEADRLTKHLLPLHTVEAADSSTPLRSAQNDSAHLTSDPEVTHDVHFYVMTLCEIISREFQKNSQLKTRCQGRVRNNQQYF